jgi:hypothetical protein
MKPYLEIREGEDGRLRVGVTSEAGAPDLAEEVRLLALAGGAS